MLPFATRYGSLRRWQSGRAWCSAWVETLESRTMLSPAGYTPSQIEHAYGYDKVSFDVDGVAVPGDGQGETVALFEVGYTPGLSQDLAVFDRAFDLRGLTSWPLGGAQPVGPFLRTIGFDGGDTIPADDSDQSEALLDVEWLHAIVPAANILIVEAAQSTDLAQADAFAASQPGVVVVSNSYSSFDYLESPDEVGDNHFFTTPPGHPGVTFVDSSGDTGAPSHPPDFSANVLSVGGTSMTLDAAGNYGSETGWAGSGGGLSLYERLPGYQFRAVPNGIQRRAVPDVAIVANKNTGVEVYNPAEGGWAIGGGTSLWAGIIAIADQGRAARGLGSLDGPTQTLPDLYRLPRRDFRTITIGNNGYRAHRGFNLVTGLGSPYVNRVVAGLVAATAVYRAPEVGQTLRPPASYFNTQPTILHATAGSAFNGIIATVRLPIPSGEAANVTATINWGDGTALNSTAIDLNPLGSRIFQIRTVSGSAGRKIFTNAGNYRIHATLTLSTGSVTRIARAIRVAPAPLTVSSQPLDARAGRLFEGTVATFTDAGALPEPTDPGATAAYSAKIGWGDGTSSAGDVAVRTNAPGFIVTGRHIYRTAGVKSVAVRAVEDLPRKERPISYVTRASVIVAKSLFRLEQARGRPRQRQRSDLAADQGTSRHRVSFGTIFFRPDAQLSMDARRAETPVRKKRAARRMRFETPAL
jgi:hypothetical protein